MSKKSIQVGTDNVLNDLGFVDSDELSTKTILAVKFNDLVDARRLNQTEVATIIGMTQPKVSQIRHYKLRNISLERLMQALVALDQRVEITVRSANQSKPRGITIAA